MSTATVTKSVEECDHDISDVGSKLEMKVAGALDSFFESQLGFVDMILV